MALDRNYLEALGLEIAKKKYYNAAKVEAVLEEFNRRSTALEEENRSLRARVDAVTFGREEIGDAILSAKTIAQQLIAEAQEESDRLLCEAKAEAERLVAEAQAQREMILADCDGRERKAFLRVQSCYEQLREQHLASLRQLDAEWQSFLCSLSDEAQSPEPEPEAADEAAPQPLPGDIAQKVSEIAEELYSLGSDD